jgi:hypothetical protein
MRRNAPRLRDTFWGDLISFLLAALSGAYFPFMGMIPYSEVLALALLPILLVSYRNRIFRKEYQTFYVLLIVWFVAQIVSDFYNGMPLQNRAKGLARIVFFAMDFLAASAIVGRSVRRVRLFFLGMLIDGLSQWFIYWRAEPFALNWKLFLGASFTMAALAFVSFWKKRRTLAVVIILLAAGAIGLHYDSRSDLLFSVITAVFVIGSNRTVRSKIVNQSIWTRMALLLILVAATVWLCETGVKWEAQHGKLSAAETYKIETQSSGKLGMLIGGRPEILVAIQAIKDRPILGFGSYADDAKYVEMLKDLNYELGYSDIEPVSTDEDFPGIPAHSHLTEAWVHGGVFASLIWFYVIYLLCRSIVQVIVGEDHSLRPLYLFVCITMFWDVLFSPWGNTRRVVEAVILVLMINLAQREKPAVPVWRVKGIGSLPKPRTYWRPSRSHIQRPQARSLRSIDPPTGSSLL